MSAYYNENDPKAAAWLRELIKADLIVAGDVDERSIEDVTPMDVAGYDQCHFFAGIGGWSYALRLAGWEDTRGVWTGSCPCQPFSAAGKGKGFSDERHLWPAWFHLCRVSRPPIIFGEQVASPAGLGWFDAVHADLEGAGYACGACDIGAASVGAPHIRQRLYWMAHRYRTGLGKQRSARLLDGERPAQRNDIDGCSATIKLAESKGQQQHGRGDSRRGRGEPSDGGKFGRMAFSDGGHPSAERLQRSGEQRFEPQDSWTCEWLPCVDGKARPIEPGTFPLAHGVPGRVGLLRGYGNAIVPQVAAKFIESYMSL